MTEEPEEITPTGRPWLLAVGAGLVIGAAAIAYYLTRKPCDCDDEEGATEAVKPLNRLRGLIERHEGSGEPEGPPVGSWDEAATRAWGAVPAGEQTLGNVEPTMDISELDFDPEEVE